MPDRGHEVAADGPRARDAEQDALGDACGESERRHRPPTLEIRCFCCLLCRPAIAVATCAPPPLTLTPPLPASPRPSQKPPESFEMLMMDGGITPGAASSCQRRIAACRFVLASVQGRPRPCPGGPPSAATSWPGIGLGSMLALHGHVEPLGGPSGRWAPAVGASCRLATPPRHSIQQQHLACASCMWLRSDGMGG